MTIFYILGFLLAVFFAFYLTNHIIKIPVFTRWKKSKVQNRIVFAVIYIAVIAVTEVALITRNVLLGSMFYALVLTAFIDLICFIARLIIGKKRPYQLILKVNRSMLLVLIPTIFLTVIGYHNAITRVEKSYEIAIHKDVADGTFLAVSDIHLGTTVKKDEITWLCDQVLEESPEALFLVGDIFDENTSEDEFEWAVKEFSRVAQSIDVVYVYGNHEQLLDKDGQGFDMESIEEQFGQAGITVLADEAVLLNNKYYIVGRKDVSEQSRKTVNQIITEAGVDTSYPVILLDHQPVELSDNAKDKLVDLQISGHTHGDQVYPFGTLAELAGVNEMTYGIRTNDDFTVVVSSGLGTWGFPVRVHSQSEYVKLCIKGKSGV